MSRAFVLFTHSRQHIETHAYGPQSSLALSFFCVFPQTIRWSMQSCISPSINAERLYMYVDAMVCITSLRIVVGTYLGPNGRRSTPLSCVARLYRRDISDALVGDKRAQSAESTLFYFLLVASLGTFYKNLFRDSGVRDCATCSADAPPTQPFVYILTSGTSRAECVPFDFTLIDFIIKFSALGSTATVAAEVCTRP